jgi:predicted nucleic acid-binding protein
VSIYVDTSALVKRYIEEPESDDCDAILRSDPVVITARHAFVETQRTLSRVIAGTELSAALDVFVTDWSHFSVVELDDTTCERAAEIAVALGVRTLDALHLGAAQRVGGAALPFLTYDLRQAQAARSLGWTVLGA